MKLRHLRSTLRPAKEHFLCFFQELRTAMIHCLGMYHARKYRDASDLKLNLGSGGVLKEGFLNIDFSKKADLRLDLRQEIPLPDNSCSVIFTEHFLEHLRYPEEAFVFALECRRMLKPGGVLLVSVPGTEWPLTDYGTGKGEYLAACEKYRWHPKDCTTFMEHINCHFRQRERDRSESHFECHRYAYDFDTMKKMLNENGFDDVQERDFDPSLDCADRRVGSLFVRAQEKSFSEKQAE